MTTLRHEGGKGLAVSRKKKKRKFSYLMCGAGKGGGNFSVGSARAEIDLHGD